jgi:hypothetical protein
LELGSDEDRADTGGDLKNFAINIERLSQCLEDPVEDLLQLFHPVEMVENEDKLIPSQADQLVVFPQEMLDAVGDLLEHLVPRTVSVSVVDDFEAIQVEIAQRGDGLELLDIL